MANVAFKKGLLANLPTEIAEGTFYITTDERAMWLDIDGTTRIRIGDFQEFPTLAALQANSNPSTTALYYVAELNCLAKWNGSQYIQINLDTGATSVEVVGDGNAVTAASYDPATRKLTLTAGATYTTAADVDTQIAAKVGDLKLGEQTFEMVKAYVDKKTDGVATDAALDTLTGRVTAAEGDIDALETKMGTLVGDDTGKSARTIANEELAKQLIPENAEEALDTLSEIAAWIQEHPKSASNMNKTLSELKTLVGSLPEGTESTTVVNYIKEYTDTALTWGAF